MRGDRFFIVINKVDQYNTLRNKYNNSTNDSVIKMILAMLFTIETFVINHFDDDQIELFYNRING